MVTDRRRLLVGLAAVPLARPALAAGLYEDQARVLASARGDGRDQVVLLDGDGNVVATADLPGRGHGGAFHPDGRHAIVFARRPGRFACVIDRHTGQISRVLASPAGRHFYGHGTFSRDGRLMFTTENDFDGERGVIGIWDAAGDYARIGELDSHGIGPHDLALAPDGHSLVIANGGILTHPDTGRSKLNIADMEPSLAVVDIRTGKLTGMWSLQHSFHKLSIRHLALTRSGGVAVAMQHEGPADETPPLVARLSAAGLDLMAAPRTIQRRMRNYAGSVAADREGNVLAVSAPRGNLVTFWTSGGDYVSSFDMADGCGVAPSGTAGEFVLSGGDGRLVRYRPLSGKVVSEARRPEFHWDNHMVADPRTG